MTSYNMTDAERKAAIEHIAAERAARLACPECSAEMRFVVTVDHGDDEGADSVHLVQCPKCKLVAAKDRL